MKRQLHLMLAGGCGALGGILCLVLATSFPVTASAQNSACTAQLNSCLVVCNRTRTPNCRSNCLDASAQCHRSQNSPARSPASGFPGQITPAARPFPGQPAAVAPSAATIGDRTELAGFRLGMTLDEIKAKIASGPRPWVMKGMFYDGSAFYAEPNGAGRQIDAWIIHAERQNAKTSELVMINVVGPVGRQRAVQIEYNTGYAGPPEAMPSPAQLTSEVQKLYGPLINNNGRIYAEDRPQGLPVWFDCNSPYQIQCGRTVRVFLTQTYAKTISLQRVMLNNGLQSASIIRAGQKTAPR